MNDTEVIHGDCLEVLPTLEADSFDSVVTDPPYGLSFMGKNWDHGVPGVEFWRQIIRVLKPGGRLLAFGGTRTEHRMTCAIEDAGFTIEDKICWLYGSGFPKQKSKLKPAYEPVVVAWKPAKRATVLNIDECRVPVNDESYAKNCSGDRGHDENRTRDLGFAMGCGRANELGRWPANVIHDGSDEVMESFAEFGEKTSGMMAPGQKRNKSLGGGGYHGDFPDEATATGTYGDSGSAARFFYCAKASRSERDEGLDGPDKPLLWSSGAKNPGSFQSEGTKKSAKNNHPTVKPIALMRYLCRLVTPAGGRVLDPFLGSGTTGIAAVQEGYKFVGIEREAEYVAIARQRVLKSESDRGLFDVRIRQEESETIASATTRPDGRGD